MRVPFLFWLFNKLKQAMFIDVAGNISEADGDYKKPDGQPAHLIDSPDGWETTSVKYARNIIYWGLFRDMSTKLKFVGDGFQILKKQMWAFGFECITYLAIHKFDRVTLPYQYEKWYVSEINYSTYEEGETYAQVETLEGGPSKYLKAYENQIYEVPIDTDPEHINVKFDGMKIFQRGNFSMEGPVSNTDFGNVAHTLPIFFINNEGDTGGTIYSSQIPEEASPIVDYMTGSSNYFISNTTGETRTYNIKGLIKFACTKNDIGALYRIDVFKHTSNVPIHNIVLGSPLVVGEITELNVDFNIVVDSGLKLFLMGTFHGLFAPGSVEAAIDFDPASNLSVNFNSKFKDTYVKGHYPLRVAKLLFEQMTGGLYTVKSLWLSGVKDCFITSQDALRGFVTDNSDPDNPIKGAVIKTSWAEFMKSMNHFSAGCGTEGDYLVVEKMESFFKSNVIANLGQVTDAKITVAKDLIFNTIKTGGPIVEYEDVNGRYETNQEQRWTTPITKIVKDGDLTTPYRRDCYGAEFARINLENKTTTDDKGDNNTWMINIKTEKLEDKELNIFYYELNRPAFTEITGVPDPEGFYNALYTPKWTLINNGAYIKSVCDRLDTELIKFSSAEKNKELRTVLSTVMDEDENIQIGALANRLFAPYYFNFVTEVPLNLLEILESDPYGKIQFQWNGRQWYGYLMDGSIQPAINDKQSWKLLAAPDQLFEKFNK